MLGKEPRQCNSIFRACEEQLGAEIVAFQDITPIQNNPERAVYIELSNGTKAKLRLISAHDNERATRLNRYFQAIGLKQFPQILAYDTGWIAFEWIVGRPISECGAYSSLYTKEALLLSEIHNTKIPADCFGTHNNLWSEVGHKLNANLKTLVSASIITPDLSSYILNGYKSHSSSHYRVSLVHCDFSPDNLVSQQDKIYSVDNDRMRVHYLEYDLAVAIGFWDKWNKSGDTFYKTYLEQSPNHVDPETLPFWKMYDSVYKISYGVTCMGVLDTFYCSRLAQLLDETDTF